MQEGFNVLETFLMSLLSSSFLSCQDKLELCVLRKLRNFLIFVFYGDAFLLYTPVVARLELVPRTLLVRMALIFIEDLNIVPLDTAISRAFHIKSLDLSMMFSFGFMIYFIHFFNVLVADMVGYVVQKLQSCATLNLKYLS